MSNRFEAEVAVDQLGRLVEERLAGLDLEERLAMLHQYAPALERWRLPPYRTGSEALHGVAWLGDATVFPQPVGMAATWDPDLLERVGAAVADELLAKRAADATISTNVWAPVVNPLRHPRWGRNEEGYSEDPHLTAALATGYARGLRGADPDRWRTVPTLKHLLAYNVESDRAVISMQVRPRVLHEYELPAFLGPLSAGVVGAVMPGYNLVNGRPCHLSADLIDAVRAAAPEEIAVVSDAGAPSNLVELQRVLPDRPSAWAAALRAGIDSFTDHGTDPTPTIDALREASELGLLTEEDVDRAAARLLRTRLRTRDCEAAAPPSIDRAEHHRLALAVARRGVVLLENDGVLPVREEPRSVAVVGPLADRVLPDWYAGTPTTTVSIVDAVRERWPGAEVRVADGADRLSLRTSDGRYLCTSADGGVVAAETGLVRAGSYDVTDWGWGLLTVADASSGLLWTLGAQGQVRAGAPRPHGWVVQESFRTTRHDDGSLGLRHVASGRWLRVDVAGRLVVADDSEDATRFWPHVHRCGTAAVSEAAQADLVICALGNDPHLLGRETQDRPSIALPPSYRAIWESASASNPAAVLVLVSSYPYGLDRDLDPAAALWSAHSQAQGSAVVDVISGDVDPSGRLAQTWWRDDDQAGELADYDVISGRSTFWYSPEPPRYPFGHGLTYGDVRYTRLDVERSADGTVTAHVEVRNDGDRVATEVVQVYTDAVDHRMPFPHRLAGFTRVPLEPGEGARVAIDLPRAMFSVWDTAREAMTVDPGRYRVSVGPDAVTAALVAELDLDGEAPIPHRLPLRAAAFDRGTGVTLEAEHLTRGIAVGGDGGLLEFDAVDGLGAAVTLRAMRTAAGDARVVVSVADDVGRHVREAVVPADAPIGEWIDVAATGLPEAGVAAVTLALVGPVRLAELRRAPVATGR